MSFQLGLTGSIGMGKSTTAQMFRDAGLPVWDADETVHRIYSEGGAAVPVIASILPEAIEDGAVSRERLKRIIADDPTALSAIEGLVHPIVARDRAAFAELHKGGITVFDIPLLYETDADHWLDAVVCVTAPADEQRRRVLERGTISEKQLGQILSRQVPDAEKRKRADFVIETTTLDAARDAVQTIIATIRQRQADARNRS